MPVTKFTVWRLTNSSVTPIIVPVAGIEPTLLITCADTYLALSRISGSNSLPSLTHLMNLERPQHLYEHLIAGLTGLEPAILGLTNLRCIPLKLQINFEDCGNFEIPTRCLTNNRSASELTIHRKRYCQLY